MKNTQSPAPGVAAEMSEYEKAWRQHLDKANRENWNAVTFDPRHMNKIVGELDRLRAALQASAAAVERRWTEYTPAGHPISVVDGGPLDSAPLPAQVQAAEVSDAEVQRAWEFLASKNGGQAITGLRSVLTDFLASRTPAPGMAGGVGAWTDLEIEGAVELWFKHHEEATGGFTGRERTLIRSAIVAAIKVASKPAAPHPSPAPQAAGAMQAEIDRLNAIINTPLADDFLRAVSTEAEHQRQRWGNEHDAGKAPADWFWLLGYLGGKALHAHAAGNMEKAEHHIITTAAACANWHRNMKGETGMRPGIDGEAALASTAGRAGS